MTRAPQTAFGLFVGGQSRRMGSPKGLLPAPASRAVPRETGGSGASQRRVSIVEHLLNTAEEAQMFPIFVVGDAGPYEGLLGDDVRRLSDDPVGIGPLGGLRALLQAVNLDAPSPLGRGPQAEVAPLHPQVIAVACDMPFVSTAHLQALVAGAAAHPEAAIVTPEPASTPSTDGRGERLTYEPMMSLYRPSRVLPALDAMVEHGRHGLQRLFQHPSLVVDPDVDAGGDVAVEGEGGGGVVCLPRARFTEGLRDWDTPEDVQRDQSSLAATDA